MKSAYEEKEKLIGYLLMGGVGAGAAGLFFLFFAFVLRSNALFAFGPVLILLGIVLAGAGAYIGFSHNRGMTTGATRRPEEEGRVVARFAINEIGEMIFDNFDYDAEEARFYVRVQFLDRRREEFECARPVFDQCGEGMRGMITMQGSWMLSFVPLMDTDETRAAYRDW
ncbi:MAG TPA: hypothetical protein VHE55_09420 [Fimbriimonadaceae bacterium]|nr:hypothetical protein [Fimbriimonadaceae bacterium]